MQSIDRVPVTRLLVVLAAALLVVAGLFALMSVGAAHADNYPGLPNDGRINIVHHFGGDALYCMDENGSPTNQFGDLGSFVVLNSSGNPVFTVDNAALDAAIAQAEANPGVGVLVAEGTGTYGYASLYTYVSEGEVRFTYTGTDEHGKVNQIDWALCTPVGPIAGEAGPDLCSLAEVDEAVIEEDLQGFELCYNLVCPDIPIELDIAAEECFCSQYPDSLACGGGRGGPQ